MCSILPWDHPAHHVAAQFPHCAHRKQRSYTFGSILLPLSALVPDFHTLVLLRYEDFLSFQIQKYAGIPKAGTNLVRNCICSRSEVLKLWFLHASPIAA